MAEPNVTGVVLEFATFFRASCDSKLVLKYNRRLGQPILIQFKLFHLQDY